MRRPNIRDLYPRTFDILERLANQTNQLIHFYLHRSDEEGTFPQEDKIKIGEKVETLLETWNGFDTDFPKENLNCAKVIEDYIWMEHMMMELEEIAEVFQVDGQKTTLYNVGNWLKEILQILEGQD